MAMARPIVATSVSDLPEILNGCGWIVPPDNTRAGRGVEACLVESP